jgi:hypothetical protein
LLLLAACETPPAYAPHAIDCKTAEDGESTCALRTQVASIVLCKATERELVAMFGPSMRDGRIGTHRLRSWLLVKSPERILGVLIDSHGVAVDISWDLPGATTWVPHDHCG